MDPAPVIPRWLAVTWIVAGLVGFVASVVVAFAGSRFVVQSAEAGLEIVEVTRGLLATASETADVLDEIVGESAAGLETVEASIATGGATLDEVAALAGDLGRVVTEDIPASLDQLNDTMPQLIATAGVIDGVMRTLSFVGVDYDPDAPLDDSIRDLDARLAEIPIELREQADAFALAADGIATFAGSTVEVAEDVGTIRQTLTDSQDLLSDYRTTVERGNEILDDVESQLSEQAGLAETALIVLGLAVAVGQTVPVAIGVRALRRTDDGAASPA